MRQFLLLPNFVGNVLEIIHLEDSNITQSLFP